MPTERPPFVAEVRANVCGQWVPRGQSGHILGFLDRCMYTHTRVCVCVCVCVCVYVCMYVWLYYMYTFLHNTLGRAV
jgi:hypothetical protein